MSEVVSRNPIHVNTRSTLQMESYLIAGERPLPRVDASSTTTHLEITTVFEKQATLLRSLSKVALRNDQSHHEGSLMRVHASRRDFASLNS
jgi:hypothetical protein